jgi:hypothetical protein
MKEWADKVEQLQIHCPECRRMFGTANVLMIAIEVKDDDIFNIDTIKRSTMRRYRFCKPRESTRIRFCRSRTRK